MEQVNMTDDRAVVNQILLRNQKVTQQYLYVKCFPLFKSVYDNYYTDCQSCMEFINEIYLHLLTPNGETGLCKLETFRFGSTLTTWLKTVAVYYCYEHYRRKRHTPMVEQKISSDDNQGDRFDQYAASMYVEEPVMDKDDLETILGMMPNKRYSKLIRLRYLEGMTNEETASTLGMTMDNFYNKHRRAKQQFNEVLKKEKQYGKLH